MNKKLLTVFFLALFFVSAFAANRIQVRRDSAAIWTIADPVLAQGEMGFELVTGKLKFGDGVTAWSSLPYFYGVSSGGGGSYTGAAPVVVNNDTNVISIPDFNTIVEFVCQGVDSNSNTECDGNSVLTGDGICQSISGFHAVGSGTDTDTIRSYTGIAPILLSNDTNTIRLVSDFNRQYQTLIDMNNFYYMKSDVNGNFVSKLDFNSVVEYIAQALDSNSNTECDGNAVLTGNGICQVITGFDLTGASEGDVNHTLHTSIPGNAFLANAVCSLDFNANTINGIGDLNFYNGTNYCTYDISLGSFGCGGELTTAAGGKSVAFGQWNQANSSYSGALWGFGNTASGDYSMVGGNSCEATQNYAICMGLNSEASGESSIVLGTASKATASYSVAIGNGVVNAFASTVALGVDANVQRNLWIGGDFNVVGDLNARNIGFSGYIFGDGSKLTGISGTDTDTIRTYIGNSPIIVENDVNVIALNIQPTSDWNGLFDGQEGSYYLTYANLTNKPSMAELVLPWADANLWRYIPSEQDIDLNAMAWDTNTQTACDNNTVATGDGTCVDISEFYLTGNGTDTDTIRTYFGTAPVVVNNDTNTISFISDFNSMIEDLIYQFDTNGSGTDTDTIRTYSGVSPIVVENDVNQVSLNVLSTSDWNGLFDGQEGSYYLDFTNLINRNFSFLLLDNNANFDARYCLLSDANNPSRFSYTVIADPPWGSTSIPDTTLDTNSEAQNYYWSNFGITTTGADANVSNDLTIASTSDANFSKNLGVDGNFYVGVDRGGPVMDYNGTHACWGWGC